MVTIAIDAMGGDKAPAPGGRGRNRAARELGHGYFWSVTAIKLNTRSISIRARNICLSKSIHAEERITMEDHAAKAARTKKGSSMHMCARMAADGKVDGFLSAGNTGACMAIAKMVLGKVPGVDRPALSGVFPTVKGTPVVVVDVGANVDCEPEMLAQFGRDGRDLFAPGAEDRSASRRHSLHRRRGA